MYKLHGIKRRTNLTGEHYFIRTATSDLKAMIKASTLKVKAWTFKATGPEAKAFMHYGQSRNQDMQYV